MVKLEFRWAVLIVTTVLALLYVQTIRYTDCRRVRFDTRKSFVLPFVANPIEYGSPQGSACIDKITGKVKVRR